MADYLDENQNTLDGKKQIGVDNLIRLTKFAFQHLC